MTPREVFQNEPGAATPGATGAGAEAADAAVTKLGD
jgi:hypothetical protein